MKHGMVFIWSMGYIVSGGVHVMFVEVYFLCACVCVCVLLAHFKIAKQEIANCNAEQSQNIMVTWKKYKRMENNFFKVERDGDIDRGK